MTGRRCPHTDVQFCPLYHLMHFGDGYGCHSDRLPEGLCAVDLGEDYKAAVARASVKYAQVVQQCAWNEDIERRKAQARRNMRVNGIH